MSFSDERLVGEVAGGDEAALAELLRRWERPLASFLHRRTGGRDVEDLYQETWMRIVQHAARFDPRRRFSTWMFQIAVNLCRDWARRQKPEISVENPPERPGDAAGSDQRIDAERLLARLPEPQREVLILRYYHDRPEAEIAEILDCPRGTVKSRLHHAVARLTRIVEEKP